jgi:trigger factor
MNITVLENKKVKYTFEVTPHEFNHGIEHAFDKAKETVEVKGFRKGHVPFSIFEKKFGVESLYEDALNHVISHKFQEVLEDDTHDVVSDPEIDLDYKEVSREKAFNISIIVDVKPEVKLGTYKGLKATYKDTSVKPQDVELELMKLRKQNAQLELKEGELLVSDTAIFDFEGFLNGEPFEGGKAENYELEIGSNQFIPGFEEQMVGMKSGESKDIHVTFPENYQAENLKGQAVVFKITLHEVKSKTPVELNDAFVETLNREEKTVDALKKALETDILKRKEEDAKRSFESDILIQVIDQAQLDIPQSMIKKEADGQINSVKKQAEQYQIPYEQLLQFQGMSVEMFEADALKQAQSRVKMNLVFEAVAKAEQLVVTETQLNEAYESIATQHKVTVDYVKNVITEKSMKQDLLPQLGYDFIISNAVKA